MEEQRSSDILIKGERDRVMNDILPDKNLTEEEFQNFMHRVTEVEKIVKKLSSNDEKEQEKGMLLADLVLEGNSQKKILDNDQLRVTSERTVINKITERDSDPNKMSREGFMRSVEKDANERAEDRKRRNERAETYKRIANGAFGLGDYEKAVTYYTKAVEQRKDSAVLWNNRGLSYTRLDLDEHALRDFEWALKINPSNIKALLNSAKCHARLGNNVKRDELVKLARELNPRFNNYINEFEKELKGNLDDETGKNKSHSIVD